MVVGFDGVSDPMIDLASYSIESDRIYVDVMILFGGWLTGCFWACAEFTVSIPVDGFYCSTNTIQSFRCNFNSLPERSKRKKSCHTD